MKRTQALVGYDGDTRCVKPSQVPDANALRTLCEYADNPAGAQDICASIHGEAACRHVAGILKGTKNLCKRVSHTQPGDIDPTLRKYAHSALADRGVNNIDDKTVTCLAQLIKEIDPECCNSEDAFKKTIHTEDGQKAIESCIRDPDAAMTMHDSAQAAKPKIIPGVTTKSPASSSTIFVLSPPGITVIIFGILISILIGYCIIHAIRAKNFSIVHRIK